MSNEIRILSRKELSDLPPPEWLIEGLVLANSTAVIYGAPSSGKTFIALDIAASIANGTDFFEKPVIKKGNVIFISAEGTTGFPQRLDAWESENDIEEDDGFYTITREINFSDNSEIRQLQEKIIEAGISPVLLVVDTLARCMVGGDENSSKDMGTVIANATLLSKTLNCVVLFIHHTGKSNSSERGSSALRGGVDTMMEVSRSNKSNSITLKCDKQKDAPEFGDIHLELTPMEESCVIRPSMNGASTSLTPAEQKCLNGFQTLGSPVTRKALIDGDFVKPGSTRYVLPGLQQKGCIRKIARGQYELIERNDNDSII